MWCGIQGPRGPTWDYGLGYTAHGRRGRAPALRPGQPNLLAAIFVGCLLRPLIVSRRAQPGALDLLGETRHDDAIVEAAWAAIAHPAV